LFTEKFRPQDASHFDAEQYICNLYFRSLLTVPAIVRDWYTSLNKQLSTAVSKYTKKYVSKLVMSREIRTMANMRRGKMEIHVMPIVNEIECSYRMEDSAMKLTISLPEDYPLGVPAIETGRAIVNKDLHKKWLFQLGIYLSRQNGRMLDGIMQWKRNIDKHLLGVEDCIICMMTVSSTTYKLPRIRCRQCNKKFHGDCLYKWFQTSSNSSCPLCRSNFF